MKDSKHNYIEIEGTKPIVEIDYAEQNVAKKAKEIESAQAAVTTSKLREDLFMMMQIALALISVFVIVYIFAPSYIRDHRLRSILKEHNASIDTSAYNNKDERGAKPAWDME